MHTTVGDVAWVLHPQEEATPTVQTCPVTIRNIGWRTAFRNKGIRLVAMNGPGPTQPTSSRALAPAMVGC